MVAQCAVRSQGVEGYPPVFLYNLRFSQRVEVFPCRHSSRSLLLNDSVYPFFKVKGSISSALTTHIYWGQIPSRPPALLPSLIHEQVLAWG